MALGFGEKGITGVRRLYMELFTIDAIAKTKNLARETMAELSDLLGVKNIDGEVSPEGIERAISVYQAVPGADAARTIIKTLEGYLRDLKIFQEDLPLYRGAA